MAKRFPVDSINLEVYDVQPFVNERSSDFVIEWGSDIGFGEYTIYKRTDSDEWRGDSEHMDNNEDKDFIRELMRLFICVMFSGNSGRLSTRFANSLEREMMFSSTDLSRGMMILLIVSLFSERI